MEMSFPSLGLEGKSCLHKTREAKKSCIWGPVSLHSFASFLFARDKNVSPFRNLVTGVMRKAPASVNDPHSILEGQSKDQDSWSRTPSVQDRPLDSRRRPLFYISVTPDLQHRTCSRGLHSHVPVTFQSSHLCGLLPWCTSLSMWMWEDAYLLFKVPLRCESRMEKKRVLVKVSAACLCSVNP